MNSKAEVRFHLASADWITEDVRQKMAVMVFSAHLSLLLIDYILIPSFPPNGTQSSLHRLSGSPVWPLYRPRTALLHQGCCIMWFLTVFCGIYFSRCFIYPFNPSSYFSILVIYSTQENNKGTLRSL